MRLRVFGDEGREEGRVSIWGSGGLRGGRTPLWTVGKLSQGLRMGRESIAWVALLSFHGHVAAASRSKV